MRTSALAPFLRPAPEVVRAAPWMDAGGRPVPPRLETWDPATDLEFSRELTIELKAVRAQTRSGEAATFAVVPSWFATGPRLAGAGRPVELGRLDCSVRVRLEIAIPGRDAGGELRLRTRLVLRNPDASAPPIAPQRAASILWQDETSTLLEGGGARFPISAVSFSASPRLPSMAAWCLEWDPDDLGAPAMAAMRLLINSDRSDVLAAVQTGARGAGSAAVRSFLQHDVAESLLVGALLSDDFCSHAQSWDELTLGRAIKDLFSAVWPDTSVLTLRQRLHSEPGRFKAELLSYYEVAAE